MSVKEIEPEVIAECGDKVKWNKKYYWVKAVIRSKGKKLAMLRNPNTKTHFTVSVENVEVVK